MIILVGLLLVRILLSITQILLDYQILLVKSHVNLMDLSDLLNYPVLILIIYIAVKYQNIQQSLERRGNENE